MTEEDVSLELLSDITCAFALQHYTEKEDGLYCTGLIAAFAAWHPSALVLDFRKLSYEWGDMVESPVAAGRDCRAWMGGLPTVVISSGRNERALNSLIDQVMGEEPAEWLFPTPEAALARVLEKYKAQRAAVGYT